MRSPLTDHKLFARNFCFSNPCMWIALIMSCYFSTLRKSVSAWTVHRITTPFPTQTARSGMLQSCKLRRNGMIYRMASAITPSDEEKPEAPKRISKKFKVVEKIEQHHLDKLAKAFDELAKKDGFDSADVFFSDDETFEDEFADDDFTTDGIQNGFEQEDISLDKAQIATTISEGKRIDYSSFDLSDFSDDADSQYRKTSENEQNLDDDMDRRIAAAMLEIKSGRFSVPQPLDDYAQRLSVDEIESLGFKKETNLSDQREKYKLVTDAMTCSACGADFQCSSESRPGYLPPEKFDLQVKLSKIEEMQRLQEKAESEEWTPEDEIEWLIQTSGKDHSAKSQDFIDIDSMAKELNLDLAKISTKKVICKRCHGLQNFGKVEESLRPGWTNEPMISQEKFLALLRPLREKTAVIIALVDLFDFSGSVLPELDNIAGDNPVILAANKADLLPSKMGTLRAENWVRRELEYLGVKSLANIGGSVRLVSCKTGWGVEQMLEKARQLAEDLNCDIYVVGSANAGKSTLINRILGGSRGSESEPRKRRAGNINARKGEVTTSPLPGTTLRFIKIDLGEGRYLYDTPGLLVPGTFTQLLTGDELKMVVPTKRVEPITFRVEGGKCVLIGGLARVELMTDCKPFLFTFFVSNDVKLHPTSADKANDFITKHAGEMLTPPLAPGAERMQQIGEFEEHIVEIEGTGWKEAAADITITGLGWVAVTGAGPATVKISVPKGIGVSVRPPLMPFDIWESTARYTGNKAVRKISKSSSGKRRKGVGRR